MNVYVKNYLLEMKKTTLKNLNHSKKKESLRQQSIISQTIQHKLFNQKLVLDLSTNQYQIYLKTYWVVRKVCADFKGKLKRRRLNFSIYLLYRCHFVLQPFSIFQATSPHPSRISQVFQRKTFLSDFLPRPKN